MPELPEVETTVRGLRKKVTGLVIRDVWTDLATPDKRKHETIANPRYFKSFREKVKNKKVLSVKRRAKNILINLSGGLTILIHLKMTGHLLYGKYKLVPPSRPGLKNSKRSGLVQGSWLPADKAGPLNDPFNRFIHAVFTLSNDKHLALSDARKFGKIVLLDTETVHTSKHLSNIGPEPLHRQFTIENFKSRIAKKPSSKIKTVLMDQSIIAGIGNIYSDEILWQAGIHPERKARELKEEETGLLFKAMREILSRGVNFGGDSMSDYRNIDGLPGRFQLQHQAYRRTGEKCRKKGCEGIIKRKIISSRSAHFCSNHQQ